LAATEPYGHALDAQVRRQSIHQQLARLAQLIAGLQREQDLQECRYARQFFVARPCLLSQVPLRHMGRCQRQRAYQDFTRTAM
jgi:hypothetical protein